MEEQANRANETQRVNGNAEQSGLRAGDTHDANDFRGRWWRAEYFETKAQERIAEGCIIAFATALIATCSYQASTPRERQCSREALHGVDPAQAEALSDSSR
jgi:hypothetical protein